ncbi:MAG: pyridoxamine 5'-phosphate oxidase family protein [Pseudomonadota bacterium]
MLDQQPLPSFYNDLDETGVEAWRLLGRGVKDRRSGFHTMTVATVSADGLPDARTVVLRGVDHLARTLRFHTDSRSKKIEALKRQPTITAVLYDAKKKIQMRASGIATVHADTALHTEAWAATRSFSRECYRVTLAPGTPINDPEAVLFDPPGGDGEAGVEVFRPVTIQVAKLEWLYLAHQGHRRALYCYDANGNQTDGTWVVP